MLNGSFRDKFKEINLQKKKQKNRKKYFGDYNYISFEIECKRND